MPARRSVPELVDDLTRAEKIQLLAGTTDPDGRSTGYLAGVDRADVPPLRMADGPLGVRIPGESSTAFPASLALAATFDTDLAAEQGAALGRETRGKGMDVLLAPGANLIRVPHNGRNFEYYSEDPVLSAAFAGAVVGGIQSEDAIATPKHYVANSQETYRASISAEVDERTLRELYLPSFRAAVEAGAGSVMTGYNGVNGTRMSDHRRLLRDVLKGEWGFDGYVVSDWFGTEGAAAAANGGLDVEMPGTTPEPPGGGTDDPEAGSGAAGDGEGEEESGAVTNEGEGYDVPEAVARGLPDPETCEGFGETLADAVEAGEVSEERLDDMATRVLWSMDRVGMLDGDRSDGAVDTPAHRELATRVATRATVLLENDGVLPLADDADVAVVGPNVDGAVLGGGGSSETTPVTETSPEAAIADRADGEVTVSYGLPRVEGVSLLDELAGGDDGDDTPARDPDVGGAAAAAEAADVAVVFVRDTATEALDRESLRLPGRQDDLVEAVAAANDRTVVVVNSSGPVELPWCDDVAAVVENWYPGQAHGDSAAAVLYGDADPSGRLPVTFAPEGTYPTSPDRRFPGADGEARYDEGVFVGYRGFDAGDAEPTYPFGHGRSYAEFDYVDAELDDGTLRVTVENTADRDGREVVQAYVRPPEGAAERPVRELAGFAAVGVDAGARETVAVDLDDRAFARYDGTDGWTVDAGTYALEVGRSAADVRLELATER